MAKTRSRRKWLSPQREGKSYGRRSLRYCRRCGNPVSVARILSAINLCEFCAKQLGEAKEGRWACKGCGKIAPHQLEKHNGYCEDCVCPACGKPDPVSVRKTGLCGRCLSATGQYCRRCGKEAPNQVKKNDGLCDACAAETR